MTALSKGELFAVATPIGNLDDVSSRALAALRDAGLVLCEDTRVSRRLLDFHGIASRLSSLHEHNERRRTARIVRQLRESRVMAPSATRGHRRSATPGERPSPRRTRPGPRSFRCRSRTPRLRRRPLRVRGIPAVAAPGATGSVGKPERRDAHRGVLRSSAPRHRDAQGSLVGFRGGKARLPRQGADQSERAFRVRFSGAGTAMA